MTTNLEPIFIYSLDHDDTLKTERDSGTLENSRQAFVVTCSSYCACASSFFAILHGCVLPLVLASGYGAAAES